MLKFPEIIRDATRTKVGMSNKEKNEDFEYCTLMERYIGKAPNPDMVVFNKYSDIIEIESSKAFYRSQRIFKSCGMELDDIKNLSRSYLVGFLGLYTLEKSPQKMAQFTQKFKERNKTEIEQNQEVILKKNRSMFIDFLKQKLETLKGVCLNKTKSIVGFETKTTCYRIKLQEDCSLESQMKESEENKIPASLYAKTRQKIKAKGKRSFEYDGYIYWAKKDEFKQPVSLDFYMENTVEEDSDVLEKSFCGNISRGDELFEIYDSLPDSEKREILESFIKKSKSKKLKEAAKQLLSEI